MNREFTATVYILKEQEVLLIFHKKLQKWLPPGGHIDPNETPAEAAVREAFEETGLQISLIPQENIWIHQSNAISIERPYMCLLENIPEHNGVPQHQHMDMIYIGKPVGGKLSENLLETEGIRWFGLQQVEKLKTHVEIYAETKEVIRTLIGAPAYA